MPNLQTYSTTYKPVIFPPLLGERIFGRVKTRGVRRIFCRASEKKIQDVCVQDLTHFEFCTIRRAGKMLKSDSWIIGSSEFFHSFFFAMQKIHSYQIPSQDVLGALRAHGALACHYLQTIAIMFA